MTWKESYRAALVEVDPAKLMGLIRDTELAMTLRKESLPKISNQELQEISDATCGLSILKSHAQLGLVLGEGVTEPSRAAPFRS